MGFIELSVLVLFLTIILSFLTNSFKNIIIVTSIIGILFYIFIADQNMRNKMDNEVKNFEFPKEYITKGFELVKGSSKKISNIIQKQ